MLVRTWVIVNVVPVECLACLTHSFGLCFLVWYTLYMCCQYLSQLNNVKLGSLFIWCLHHNSSVFITIPLWSFTVMIVLFDIKYSFPNTHSRQLGEQRSHPRATRHGQYPAGQTEPTKLSIQPTIRSIKSQPDTQFCNETLEVQSH